LDYTSILLLVALVAVFYFILIRPENKRKKNLEQMRSELVVGDTITTIGGIKGKIVHISDDSLTFETGEDRVRLEVAKWAVSTTGKMEKVQEEQRQQKQAGGFLGFGRKNKSDKENKDE